MTTIATDGKTIAADGQIVASGERLFLDAKKIVVKHGRIYALAGVAAMLEPLIEWHNDGADPSCMPSAKDNAWYLLVIDRDRSVGYYTNECAYPTMMQYPTALGSGERFAMGAMLAGKSPREAVEIACKVDVNSGGTITEIDIALALAGGDVVPINTSDVGAKRKRTQS